MIRIGMQQKEERKERKIVNIKWAHTHARSIALVAPCFLEPGTDSQTLNLFVPPKRRRKEGRKEKDKAEETCSLTLLS
jgi:hypothetical protein